MYCSTCGANLTAYYASFRDLRNDSYQTNYAYSLRDFPHPISDGVNRPKASPDYNELDSAYARISIIHFQVKNSY